MSVHISQFCNEIFRDFLLTHNLFSLSLFYLLTEKDIDNDMSNHYGDNINNPFDCVDVDLVELNLDYYYNNNKNNMIQFIARKQNEKITIK
jgi:hypothetical protein